MPPENPHSRDKTLVSFPPPAPALGDRSDSVIVATEIRRLALEGGGKELEAIDPNILLSIRAILQASNGTAPLLSGPRQTTFRINKSLAENPTIPRVNSEVFSRCFAPYFEQTTEGSYPSSMTWDQIAPFWVVSEHNLFEPQLMGFHVKHLGRKAAYHCALTHLKIV